LNLPVEQKLQFAKVVQSGKNNVSLLDVIFFPADKFSFPIFFLSSGVSISFRLNFSTVLILNKSPQGFFQAFEILLNFNIIE
jgi:hypothetical protein